MKKLTLIVLAVVGLMACHTHDHDHDHGHHHGDEGDKAWSEVDALHDEVMAHYATTLTDLDEKLEAVVEQAKEDESTLKGFSLNQVEAIWEQVEASISGMDTWMRAHGEARASIEGQSEEDVAKIIETERQAIQKISDQTNKSMDAAKELLKGLGITVMEADVEGGHDHDHHDHDGHDHNHDH